MYFALLYLYLDHILGLVSSDSVHTSSDVSGGLVLELKKDESFEAVRFLRHSVHC